MEANLFSILAVGTPILAIPVTLVFGLRKALMICLAVGCLMLVVPYVYFGVWALIAGEGLWDTMTAISFVSSAIALIVGWMLVWTAAYGAVAALIRLGWLHWKGTPT